MFSAYSGNGGDGWSGLAWTGIICSSKTHSYNMNMWTYNSALSTAWVNSYEIQTTRTLNSDFQVAAHETGHSLGMSHDPDKGCPSRGYWMGPGVYPGSTSGNAWSSCSKNDFQAHYNRNRNRWCMPGRLHTL